MIPNAGLDNIAAYAAWGTATGTGVSGSVNDASGTQWLAYAAISEDSSTPTASDTGIGTESIRTNNTGGFSRTTTAIRNAGTNRVGVSIERAYVFAISANLNITKYGYVPLSSGGNFSWIDLVRVDPNDPGSTPVTLTLVPGDQLQLWQTLSVTVPWRVDLEDFVITGTAGNDAAGTHDAYCGFFAINSTIGVNGDTSGGLGELIRKVFWPNVAPGLVWTSQASPSNGRDTTLGPNTSYAALNATATLATYVAGTYYRDKVFKFTTAEGNAALTALCVPSTGGTLLRPDAPHGFKIVFDDPSTIVKDNLHELTVAFRVSWQEG